MRLQTLIMMASILTMSTVSVAATSSGDFKGIFCESTMTTHSEVFVESLKIARTSPLGETSPRFEMIHIPKYDSKVESPKPVVLAVDLSLRELSLE
ncbi:MAG: hypothetical protein AB7H97_16710, partial [Pseudobdellovibrionaceae bacterium]